MGALDVFDNSAALEYAAQHPAKDLDPPTAPLLGAAYAAIGIVLVLIVYIACVRYWRTTGEGLSRWLLRPITRKATRGGRTLRTWWLED